VVKGTGIGYSYSFHKVIKPHKFELLNAPPSSLQAVMAELFHTTPQNITMHIKAIYDEEELIEKATCKDYLQV
jgi:hypothetical protein